MVSTYRRDKSGGEATLNGEEPNRDTDPQAACLIEAEPHAARLENQPEPGTDEIEVRARGASRVAAPAHASAQRSTCAIGADCGAFHGQSNAMAAAIPAPSFRANSGEHTRRRIGRGTDMESFLFMTCVTWISFLALLVWLTGH